MLTQEETQAAPKAGRREWIGLAVISVACLLYVMDLSVLYLAVPSLAKDLAPSSTQLLWITDIYGFMVAGFLITMGTLGDRIGRRRILLVGAAAFGASSIVAALSTSAGMLIASRALLGIAGATIAPSTLSLIRNMFLDDGERTRAISIWGTSFATGGAVGPLIGGLLLEHFWWGSVFLINVPVMAVLLTLGPRLLPEFRDSNAGRPDIASVALSLTAVLSLIYGLKHVAQDGFDSVAAATIGGGLLVGAAFVRRQLKLDDPLLDLSMFKRPSFSVSVATNALGGFIAFGTFLYMAQYLQLVAGLSPMQAGLWSLPSSLAVIASSMCSPNVLRGIRPAFAAAGGLFLIAAGLGLMTQVEAGSGIGLMVFGSVLFAAGLGPVFVLTTDLIIGSAPPEKAGAASGISETGAELGGAMGIAILGSIGAAVYRTNVFDAIPSGASQAAGDAARDTLGGALTLAQQLPAEPARQLVDIATNAFTQGLQLSAGIGATIALGMAFLVLALLRDLPPGGGYAAVPQEESMARPTPESHVLERACAEC